MSWSRRSVIALATVPIAACFKPMLAEDSAATELRGRIDLPPIDGRFGYFLGKSLEDQLGRPAGSAYRLEVATSLSEKGLAVAQDNSVTRITVIAEARWALVRKSDGARIMTDRVVTQSGYGATASLFATRQTRRDIERRLARDIGERISRAILARAGSLQA